MPDSISGSSDADLITLANTVIAAITGTPATYGLTAADVLALSTSALNFQNSLNAQSVAQAAAKSATETKNTDRDALETDLRRVRNVSKAHGTSAADLHTLGIPIGGPSLPTTATVPIASIDTRERMKHTINFHDASETSSKRRPRGTIGAEIFVKIGEPAPGGEKDCVFLALDTATPYVAEYTPADVNKNAYYMLRWRMSDGSVSGWSETVSATITA
jgi:hypothetical protein